MKGLELKRDQFKLAARNSNRDGDKETAKTYLIISKVHIAFIQVQSLKKMTVNMLPDRGAQLRVHS